MKKVRLAIIGAGFISQLAHLPSFYSNPKVKIVALCDLNKKLLDKVSKKFQIIQKNQVLGNYFLIKKGLSLIKKNLA